MDVQVSLCMQCKNHSECCDAKVAEAVKCLVPHLCGISMQPSFPFRLQPLLPAAPQLERLEAIVTDSETFSLLGQFPMLKDVYVHVRHSIQLTAPLPQLHTLRLLSWRVPLRQDTLQCLVSHATALRRLVLGCKSKSHSGLQRWDIQALVGVQCQQLQWLTLQTNIIDVHTVTCWHASSVPCSCTLTCSSGASWEAGHFLHCWQGSPIWWRCHYTTLPLPQLRIGTSVKHVCPMYDGLRFQASRWTKMTRICPFRAF